MSKYSKAMDAMLGDTDKLFNIGIGKSEKAKALQASHDILAKAYVRLESLAAKLTGSLLMMTVHLERVGDQRKDAEIINNAREVIAESNFILEGDQTDDEIRSYHENFFQERP